MPYFILKINISYYYYYKFYAVQKVSGNGKKTSASPKKVWRYYALNIYLTFKRTKTDFEIQFMWRSQWPQRYLADEDRIQKVANFFGIKKLTVSKIAGVSLKLFRNTLQIRNILPTNENDMSQIASNFYNSYRFAQALM